MLLYRPKSDLSYLHLLVRKGFSRLRVSMLRLVMFRMFSLSRSKCS